VGQSSSARNNAHLPASSKTSCREPSRRDLLNRMTRSVILRISQGFATTTTKFETPADTDSHLELSTMSDRPGDDVVKRPFPKMPLTSIAEANTWMTVPRSFDQTLGPRQMRFFDESSNGAVVITAVLPETAAQGFVESPFDAYLVGPTAARTYPNVPQKPSQAKTFDNVGELLVAGQTATPDIKQAVPFRKMPDEPAAQHYFNGSIANIGQMQITHFRPWTVGEGLRQPTTVTFLETKQVNDLPDRKLSHSFDSFCSQGTSRCPR